MKNVLLSLLVAGSVIGAAATSASAQGVYFGVGDGAHEHHWDRDRHERDGQEYRHREDRGYRPYAVYGDDDCYYQTSRHFDRYRGVWVVRRVRVCD